MDRRAGVAALNIGCAGRQVRIRGSDPEVRAAIAAAFGAASEPPRARPVARLTLGRRDGGYVVAGGREPAGADGSLADALRRLRYRATLHLMAARPDLLWLHAAAAVRDGQVVLLTGPGGSGKSTLAIELMAFGFRYLGDDVIPLDPRTGVVYPFPVTPFLRSNPGCTVQPEVVSTLPRFEVRLDETWVSRAPAPVRLVVFPTYARGARDVQRCPPARAALDLLCQSLDIGPDREPTIRAVSALAATLPAVRLRFGHSGRAAAEVAAALARECA